MSTERLPLNEVYGKPYQCGLSYGELFASKIHIFYKQEMGFFERMLGYAKKCWKYTQEHAPHSKEILRGIGQGSGLDIDKLTLLLLHEEMAQKSEGAIPHCSALARKEDLTLRKQTVVAQTWDWGFSAYPWPGILKMIFPSSPRTLTYHFPGLWASCGINEEGLALMWTGGYNVPIKNQVGLPTYVLISELLTCETTAEAIAYLNNITPAGAFLFFIGDAYKHICVVEYIPGNCQIIETSDALYRANHFMLHKSVPQKKWGCVDPKESIGRYEYLKKVVRQKRSVQKILTSHPIFSMTEGALTLDCLIANCQEKSLVTCRGGTAPGPWQKFYV